VHVRQEWLAHGLAAGAADRATTEQCLARLYARCSRPRPRFVWVGSPAAALPHLAGLPTHDVLYAWATTVSPQGTPPVASDIATGVSRLRGGLDAYADHPDLDAPPGAKRPEKGRPWLHQPPLDALRAGVPLRELLRHGVRDALYTSLGHGFFLPVRAALGPVPVCWYGQQDAFWIAYYDTLRRLGLARYPSALAEQLDDWAALARSAGWWWPGEEVCVVVERSAEIRTEPVPGGRHEEVRLRPGAEPAVVYPDGWHPPRRSASPVRVREDMSGDLRAERTITQSLDR
jgi:Domain of unknown function (DUF6745)